MKTLLTLTLLAVALALGACSTNRSGPVAGAETTSSGPTVYGQLSVSVDHASTQ
ncbi:hypothetical protein [Thiocapsa sp.]|uniref:hypothetical protein n=1 Tax=Thiocapsa sp. TaxID=2024551 RepID=UPI003593FBF5